MTAEIAVMNKQGLALAADSAVTITGYGNHTQVWSSAEKLFQLNLRDPVAVMIYGAAELTGVPWEIIIKEARRRCEQAPHASLQGYVDEFLGFIKASKSLFPRKTQDEHLALLGSAELRSALMEIQREKQELGVGQTEGVNMNEIIGRVTSMRTAACKAERFVKGPIKKVRDEAWKRIQPSILEKSRPLLDAFNINSKQEKALMSMVREALFRQVSIGTHAGVVFAGFGESQFFPEIICLELDGMIAGHPRLWRIDNLSSEITQERPSVIVPFAQRDVVETFLGGIDERLFAAIKGTAESAFSLLAESIENVIDGDDSLAPLLSVLKKGCIDIPKKLIENWNSLQVENLMPIWNAVATLPKDELARLAESLVDLTSIRRRFALVADTVGGPVDVAVITKGDGFVWTKRKHYFPSDLNHRFFRSKVD